MNATVFFFYGLSGSGKGTQAHLLIDALKRRSERRVLYVETGSLLRAFVKKGGSFSSKLTGDTLQEGGLLPPFLSVWIWSNALIERFTGSEHLVLDGLARRAQESPVLDSALDFFELQSRHLIIINVSKEWAADRLMARGRGDDDPDEIKKRLAWYEDNVTPAINYFVRSNKYIVHEIYGEQSIEKVHGDIVRSIFGHD